jgi:hypothetical protein
MIQLKKSLIAFGMPDFNTVLIKEIEQMGVNELPLQQGLTNSSYALDSNVKAIIFNISEEKSKISIKAGIYYTGIIAGCNCADDPTPADEQSEYCEVRIDIEKKSANSVIYLINE